MEVQSFINGKLSSPGSNRRLSIQNPASGDEIGHLMLADKSFVNEAVSAAHAAYPAWAATTPVKRAKILFAYRDLLTQNIDELSQIITAEHGKTLADAKGSVLRGIECLEHACSIPNLLKGDFSENVATGMDCYTLRQPLGVCAGVSPFNFPVMVPMWMFVWAIACGNTFILKPSEQDPSAALRLAQLFQEAGLPDGVLNVVQGDKEAVDALLMHPDVKAMTAVASTPVAKSIYEKAIAHGKRAHTFGGAKNHCVVMPDADLANAARAIAGAGYGSAGERCMALSAVIAVGDETADKLVALLKDEIEKLRIGSGTQADVDMGPLISSAHRDKVKDYIDIGVGEGAELVVDGRTCVVARDEKGFYLGPSLFDRVTNSMRIYQEEIFGPVLSLMRVKDFETALQRVSKHRYGNGTAIFTRDGQLAQRFASQAQVGMVGVNVAIPVPVAYHSFGGWKESFFGDVGMHATQSIQFYTKLKTVTVQWPKGDAHSGAYVMPTMNK